MLHTPLCDELGIQYPIIQAGMGIYKGVVTTPELVAAVSNAGGMGCLGATGLEPDELRAAIRKVRSMTDKPFSVDLIVPARLTTEGGTREDIRADIRKNHPEHWKAVEELFARFGIERSVIDKTYSLTHELTDAQVTVVLEERVPLLVLALGTASRFIDRAREAGTRIAGLVGTVRNARKQVEAGAEFIIAQGGEAGGHVGSVATLPLVPQVVDAVAPVPVIAAGGIGDGRGLAAALALGAEAVWCGTAFLFSEEANVHEVHRSQLEKGRSEDFTESAVFTGKPTRTFQNEVKEFWKKKGLQPLGMPHQKVLMEDFIDAARNAGQLEAVNNPAGQIAGMLHGRRTAAEIVASMVREAEEVIGRMATHLRH